MSDSRRAAATWLAAAVLLLVVGLVVAARGNEALTSSEPNRVMLLLATLVFEGGYVLAWLAASAGYRSRTRMRCWRGCCWICP